MQQQVQTTNNSIKLINLFLLPGLLGIALALILNNFVVTGLIVVLPLLIILSVYILRLPIILFFAIFILNYFIMGVSRYIEVPGVSVIVDVIMACILVLLVIHSALLREIEWKHAANVLTIGSFIWLIYCLAEIYNPSGVLKGWILSRGLAYYGLMISLFVALLFDQYKWIKYVVFMLAVFTLIAVAKALIQKSVGFDYAEVAWLNKGSYRTHLIHSGTRYFSFFTDAGNFGSNMGCAGVMFFIAALYIKNNYLKVFYGIVSILAIYAMFISGTRGAMIVPLAGLALFAVISKNIKILTASGLALLLIYCFFVFTDIGQGNAQIRRMRTAFRPTADASFNVRKENQRILGEHLKNKPFGEGLGLSGPENRDISDRLTTRIPNDSWYVKIWVETGVVGLILYLGTLFLAIGKGAYIIMYKVKNRELKGLLAGLLCGIFGMLISAYGNPFWGQFPTTIIAFTGIAITLKGEYFEQQLSKLQIQDK